MENKKKEIDIIIPTYRAHNIIYKALGSILEQTLLDKVKVYIVNDCCPEGTYKKIVKHFKNYMDIEELKTPKNGGPGIARQFGIDHSDSPYIVFLDADDTFHGAFALEYLYNGIASRDWIMCCTANFLEETNNHDFISHEMDKTWMFGKIFRRSFLEEKNITFSTDRANEDVGFNLLVQMMVENPRQISFSDIPVYMWHFNPNSITKKNKGQYYFDRGFVGWISNVLRDFNIAMKNKDVDLENLEQIFWEVLLKAYCMYNEMLDVAPVFKDQNFYYIKALWYKTKEWRKPWRENIDLKEMYQSYIIEYLTTFNPQPFYFQISLFDFIKEIEENEFNEDEIIEINKKIPEEYKQHNYKTGSASEEEYK